MGMIFLFHLRHVKMSSKSVLKSTICLYATCLDRVFGGNLKMYVRTYAVYSTHRNAIFQYCLIRHSFALSTDTFTA